MPASRSIRRPREIAFVALLCAALAPQARAGQVRINVTDNAFVGPSGNSTTALNQGDQVVWVWTGVGFHTVTSGAPCTPSGPFNTGATGISGARFTWKSNFTGTQTYFCIPHCGVGMTGTLNISASGIQVSNFRISEVRFSTVHDSDFVEITNMGGAAGNLGAYRISIANGTSTTFPLDNMPVAAGARVVLHFNQTGSDDAANLYFPGVPLPVPGSASLYVPNTVVTSLANFTMMVDFVQWGAAGQPNEATANSAGAWTTGEFAPVVADGHSIVFCGTAAQRGNAFWQGSGVPTAGLANDCTTAALPSTWGRIKTLYR